MTAHVRVFTPQKVALMQQMADAGCSAREIAEAIGSTPSSVRVVCSCQKIQLKAGRRPASGHVEQLVERFQSLNHMWPSKEPHFSV
jgi:hypothetical protein